MLWLGWILVAVVCAVLFSVIKTLDRVTFAMQLLDARLDRMTAGLEELKTLVSVTHARLEQNPSSSPKVLGDSRRTG